MLVQSDFAAWVSWHLTCARICAIVPRMLIRQPTGTSRVDEQAGGFRAAAAPQFRVAHAPCLQILPETFGYFGKKWSAEHWLGPARRRILFHPCPSLVTRFLLHPLAIYRSSPTWISAAANQDQMRKTGIRLELHGNRCPWTVKRAQSGSEGKGTQNFKQF